MILFVAILYLQKRKDVIYIWQRTQPQYDVTQGRFFYNIDRVEIVYPLTVRIHTKRPEPLIEVLLSDRCAGIVSKA